MKGILLPLLLVAAPAGAQVDSASVRVDGMSCPFCAFGVEKRLAKVGGVESIEIHIDRSLAVLAAAAGASIALEQVPAAIRKAGFTPGEIEASAAGTVHEGADGRIELRWGTNGTQDLELDVPDELRSKVRELADAGAPVRVRGLLIHCDGRTALRAAEIRE